MDSRPCRIVSFFGFLGIAVFAGLVAEAAELENLAAKATARASSEHDGHYLAKFAVDGKIPPALSESADRDASWCVLKTRSGDQADFTLTWPQPVPLAELVYWGRTSFTVADCWKDYEVYLDGASSPVVRGRFRMVDGPQRIQIPPAAVTKVTLKFLNSHHGPNPGALEIQAFARSPSQAELAGMPRRPNGVLDLMPWVEKNDPRDIRELVLQLMQLHGDHYPQATEHLARLDKLDMSQDGLEQLERDVLLFDVDNLLVIERHEINATHVYTYHYEGFQAGGGLYVVSRKDRKAKRLLVGSPEGQILDCELSYDGKTALFSWRQRENEGYHLWAIGVDGSGLRQLTRGPWHDYNACWLPDGGIAFLSTRSPQFAYCWHAPVGVLHRMNADGSGVSKLSGNYLNDFTPAVLDDGRIIYTRWEYVDRPAIPIQSLWTINPDGTGLRGYFGNRVISPATFMEARSIPGTTKILCTMTGHNGPTRGAIGIVDRSRGDNVQEAIENITPDVPLPKVNEGCGNTVGTKQYGCPFPLDGVRFLCSIRGPVLVRTLKGECQSLALAAPDNGMQYFCPQPIRPRPRPPAIPSTLASATQANSGRTTIASQKSDAVGQVTNLPGSLDTSPTADDATVFLQDVYNGLEPYVARGEIKTIRVVREMPKTVRIDPSLRAFGFQFPVISCGATYAGKTVLGDVPVEPDGSALFRVPAGIPIYFMALDAQGRAVQRMRSFTHLMPGEVQGCIGCHEHRLQASRPTMPAAVGLTPKLLTPPEWGVTGFDYSRIVQPVLDRYCAECHNAVDAPKRIDLTGGKTDFFNVSYDVLAREHQGRRGSPYVNWIPTYNGQEWNILEIHPKTWGSPRSKLADVVLSGHPDEKGKPRFAMDETSRRRILSWIDLNVPYYGSSETAYPEKVGCRQILPDGLESTLADVASRRCAACHARGRIPRRDWVRITEPELNPFLVAPLARSAGGSQKCGKPVFADQSDADYQKILATFAPVTAMLKARPRIDMPGGKPAADVCRACQ